MTNKNKEYVEDENSGLKLSDLIKFFGFIVFFQTMILSGCILSNINHYKMIDKGTYEAVTFKQSKDTSLVKHINTVRGDVYAHFYVHGHQYKSYTCEGILKKRDQIEICKLIRNENNKILEIETDKRINQQNNNVTYEIREIIYQDATNKTKKLVIKKINYSEQQLLYQYKNKVILYVILDSILLLLACVVFYKCRYSDNYKKNSKLTAKLFDICRVLIFIFIAFQFALIWQLLLSL